ncbi:N-acetyltransferase family protein [Agrobacterium sp. CG674]
MTLRIRDALPSDASSLAAISLEVWIGTYLRLGVNAFFADYALREFTSEKFEAILGSANDHLIVSENEDGIDGFIRLSFDLPAPSPSMAQTEIKTLYLQPRHHGKGIGKRLLQAALAICAAKDIETVWLSVNTENSAARQFYMANGFVTIGETHFRIDDQAYLNEVMECRTR